MTPDADALQRMVDMYFKDQMTTKDVIDILANMLADALKRIEVLETK